MSLLSVAVGCQRSELNVYKSDLSSLTWKVPDTQEMREARQPTSVHELPVPLNLNWK